MDLLENTANMVTLFEVLELGTEGVFMHPHLVDASNIISSEASGSLSWYLSGFDMARRRHV